MFSTGKGDINFNQFTICKKLQPHYSLVGQVPVYHAGGSGSIPGWTNSQGLKIIEEKVLLLL